MKDKLENLRQQHRGLLLETYDFCKELTTELKEKLKDNTVFVNISLQESVLISKETKWTDSEIMVVSNVIGGYNYLNETMNYVEFSLLEGVKE
jgi:hypothetical protein